MIEPQTEPQNVRLLSATLNRHAQINADADTAGMRARIVRLERDRYAAFLALDAAIALLDEYEAENEGMTDV